MTRTDRIAYVHMPKTGGTWVAAFLEGQCGGVSEGGHVPAWALTEAQRAGRLVVGTIRDPWSWYESLYLHAYRDPHTRKPWRWTRAERGRGVAPFCEVLWGMTHPAEVRRPDPPGLIWRPHPGSEEALWDEPALGLWSWAVQEFYGWRLADAPWARPDAQWAVDALVSTGDLVEGFARLTGVRPALAPLNTRDGKPHTAAEVGAWDREMRTWVQCADEPLWLELRRRFG